MQPRYSPNGSEIAFTSDRGGGDNIWVMDRDGSTSRQITKEDFRLLNQADWSPDGNYIVARKHFTSARSLGAGEMWLYHRAGGGGGVQMTKARTKQKDTNEPAFSPDGRYLYFSDDATPGEVVRIFEGRQRPDLRHPAPRPADRRHRDLRRRPRRRDPPDALARRQDLGLHPPRPLQIDFDADGHRVRPDHRR